MRPFGLTRLQVSLAAGSVTAAAAGGAAILKGRDAMGIGLWILGGLSVVGCIAAGSVDRVTSAVTSAVTTTVAEAVDRVDKSLTAHKTILDRLTELEQRQLGVLERMERLGALN
ncbi:hypothetical protein [Thermomonospora amylolytica]|uniref:hypothetical protein n=1 Tax=Thermomonospora amylolytica TaxID=1411117 RepID=UPI000E6C1CB1|nr:hypothetical protein [Thermomonospora amylolytica]